MRTLILHLTNGEVKEWETGFMEQCSRWAMDETVTALIKMHDGAIINLNHVVWMEEKKIV